MATVVATDDALMGITMVTDGLFLVITQVAFVHLSYKIAVQK